jgi:uncharacterized surface protein with fasciclin (FAS1) repeats
MNKSTFSAVGLISSGALMMLGFSSYALAGAHSSAAPETAKDIVATAVAADDFNTLAAALEAADLIAALQGEGPYTVFAPTDAAFAALPEGTVEELLLPENKDKLTAILLYHVVPGQIMAADISGTATPETLEGDTVEVVSSSGGVTVNGANVVSADVGASNGVIHVIDAVILPPES